MPERPDRYHRHGFPAAIIAHAVWLYNRFALSLGDVEELLYERGVVVTYETVRAWVAKFGAHYAAALRKRAARPGRTWHMDEVFSRMPGSWSTSGARSTSTGGCSTSSRRSTATPRRPSASSAGYLPRRRATRPDRDRPPGELRRRGGPPPGTRTGRAPAGARGRTIEQPRGAIAPANAAARVRHASVQVGALGPAVPGGVRPALEPLPPAAPSAHGGGAPCGEARPVLRMARTRECRHVGRHGGSAQRVLTAPAGRSRLP